MLTGGLTAHDAVPMSHFIVLLGASGSLIVNAHGWSVKGVVDIDVDVCRLVVPASLIGTVAGFIMNAKISDTVVMKGLAIILTVLIVVVLQIWWRQRNEELGQLARPLEEEASAAAGGGRPSQPGDAPGYNGVVVDAAQKPKGGQLGITKTEVCCGIVLLVVVDICSVVRFHLTACGQDMKSAPAMDWYPVSCSHSVLLTTFGEEAEKFIDNGLFMVMLSIAPVKFCLSASAYYSWHLYSNAAWKTSDLLAYTVMAFSTGVLAGLIGIGGGLIFSPFFLMTMDPLVAVGTSSTCLLFIAASATLQYAFTDRIIMSLAVAYGVVTFAASIVGTVTIRQVRNKMPQGKSFITLIVAIVVILTNCLTLAKLGVPAVQSAVLKIMG